MRTISCTGLLPAVFGWGGGGEAVAQRLVSPLPPRDHLTCQAGSSEASGCGTVFLGRQFAGREVVGKISPGTVLSFLSWTSFIPLPRLLLEQKGKPVSLEPFTVAVWVGSFPAPVLTSACPRLGESSPCLSWWKAQVPPQRARAHFLRRRWAWEDKAAVVCEPPQTSLLAAPHPHFVSSFSRNNRTCFFLGAYLSAGVWSVL